MLTVGAGLLLIYGVTSYDLLSFAGAVAVVAGISLTASALPAGRAARIDPMVVLKEE